MVALRPERRAIEANSWQLEEVVSAANLRDGFPCRYSDVSGAHVVQGFPDGLDGGGSFPGALVLDLVELRAPLGREVTAAVRELRIEKIA
jgi:hypothetical protein